MWFYNIYNIYLSSKQGYTCSETGKSKIMIYIYWRKEKAQNSGPIATLFKFLIFFFLQPFFYLNNPT